jgi:hypothetical protein
MNRRALATLLLVCSLTGSGAGCRFMDGNDNPGGGSPGLDPDITVSSRPLVDPGTIVVNTGTDVGTAPGDFAVDADGAATYRVPLWTPESVSDATRPSLALRYSSSAGEGRLGYGWGSPR